MNYSLSYHHVDHSGAFDEFVKVKMERMKALFKRNSNVELVADKDGHAFSFKVRVHDGRNHFYIKSRSHNVYKAASLGMRRMKQWLKSSH